MSTNLSKRVEFGFERTECGCHVCTTNCQFMPGFLIPADLDRLIPVGTGEERSAWIAGNLLASPGALVLKDGKPFRIPTLVPAVKPGTTACINLTADGKCGVWENAPFGCAFFDCGPERGQLSHKGIIAVMQEWIKFQCNEDSLYCTIWTYLWGVGKRQKSANELRLQMSQVTGRL